MAEVTIYSTKVCPYCVRAKMLLDKKNVKYTEVDVTNPQERQKLMERTNGARTVPQIYIGDYHVGGSDDLYALDSQGKLDELLAG
ncbi:glutaredoxin 3 [Rickettsiales bacterium]|nr:glutaredoxin 3 [Rickettsiales bacterium]